MCYQPFIPDDSEVLCSLLVEKFHEYENLDIVGIAHNYSDAIKSISLTKPDVTILFIIFTNYPYPQYRKECLDKGTDYFFDKYAEFNEIFKVVKN